MKKAISLILVLTMLLCLCACGNDDPASDVVILPATDNNTPAADAPADVVDPEEPAVDAPAQEGGYVFTADGVDIAMNAPVADILTALGEPKSYTERPSCAFEGLDKTYFFGSFYLETYPGADGDYVHCVWLVDDSVATAEGIYIGSSQQDVESAYGAEHFDGSNSYVMEQGDSTLTVILENGVVSSIQYDAIVG